MAREKSNKKDHDENVEEELQEYASRSSKKASMAALKIKKMLTIDLEEEDEENKLQENADEVLEEEGKVPAVINSVKNE